MKALVGTFNQEEALVGAFSVIVKTDGSFAALVKIVNITTQRGYLVQSVHTHTAPVLQVGTGGQHGRVSAVAGGHHPVGALVAAPVRVVEVVPP